MEAKQTIGLVGNGRVGSAVVDLLKNHYSVLIFDPLHTDKVGIQTMRFVSSINDLADCILTIVCVPTPQSADGSCDISFVCEVVKTIPGELVLIKSTITPGTTDRLMKETGKRIVFSPEYVGESKYYNPYFNDNMRDTPFLVLGGDKRDTSAVLDIFLPILGPTKTYFQTTAVNAEMIKYVENTYFATKVTYVNEIYEICKHLGADWNEVREGWLLDPRVERMHTAVFPKKRGFGGKCYPKDLSALIAASVKTGYEPKLLKQVELSNTDFSAMNESQQHIKSEDTVTSQLKKKTILVTGGAGFIGSFVARRLIQNGYNVIIVDNFNTYYDPLLKEHRIRSVVNQSTPLYQVDIADYKALEVVFKEQKIDQICHLAAQAGVRYSLENPFVFEESNIKGTLNLLDLAVKNSVERFVFASSASVYGANEKVPFSESDHTDTIISLYGATKKSTEHLVHSYHKTFGLHAAGLRYFSVYGPWGRPDSVLYTFVTNIINDVPIEVYGHGQPQRDFTYIDDIVEGTIKAIENKNEWDIVNLGCGHPINLDLFVSSIEDNLSKKAVKRYLPMQKGDIPISFADNRKAKEIYGWQPTTQVNNGIKKYIDWYKDYYHISL